MTSKAQVVAVIKQLPAIIAGKAADQHGFRNTFMAAFMYRLMQQVEEAYEIKSHGGSDNLGHKFEPLSARWAKKKTTARRYRKYPMAVQGAIMRLTDKMFRSFAAGSFDTLRYFPPKNQVVELQAGLVKIFSEVEYAEFQAKKRPLIPDDIGPWVGNAIDFALDYLSRQLKYVL